MLVLAMALAGWCCPPVAGAASSDIVGEVLSVRGLMSALHTDGAIDVLGPGNRLLRGDVLITGDNGYGSIKLTDGSRINLRPGTRFVIEDYVDEPEKPSIGLRLFRGGIRAITGWIAKKRQRDGFQLFTKTAVVGIRGTEFDARLCEGDCEGDAVRGRAGERPVAATIGRVVRTTGHLAAFEPDGRARNLMAGAAVLQGDRLETGASGFALVVFRDGSRVTLQPRSLFTVDDYQYKKDDPVKTPSAFFRLIRGGLRMLTGAIAKARPDQLQVATPTAVAGVRGTGFDITLCKAPCEVPSAPEKDVVGRVISVTGPMSAEASGNVRRSLKQGDGVFQGDILQTGARTVAVVVFKDDSRVSLQPATRFAVSRYEYAGEKEEGALFRLYRGGIRLLTGWMAKRTRNYTVETATAVMGVRGTGADLLCTGNCVSGDDTLPPIGGGAVSEDLGLVARVWDGTISLTNDSGEILVGTGKVVSITSFQTPAVFLPETPSVLDQLPAPRPDQLTVDVKNLFSALTPGETPPTIIVNTWEGEVVLETESGQSLSIMPGETFLYAGGAAIPLQLTAPPAIMLDSPGPRPDQEPVDMEQLFDSTESTGTDPGLYVSVYDGDIVLSNEYGEVYIGKGEAGFAGFEPGSPVRLAAQPLFLILDPYVGPTPGGDDLQNALDVFNEDVGGPDTRKETECEIR